MKVSISKDGNTLTIELPISPRPSKSGKTTVVASSNGNRPVAAEYNGQPLVVGVNAYVPK
jgi:hypothetical protein